MHRVTHAGLAPGRLTDTSKVLMFLFSFPYPYSYITRIRILKLIQISEVNSSKSGGANVKGLRGFKSRYLRT